MKRQYGFLAGSLYDFWHSTLGDIEAYEHRVMVRTPVKNVDEFKVVLEREITEGRMDRLLADTMIYPLERLLETPNSNDWWKLFYTLPHIQTVFSKLLHQQDPIKYKRLKFSIEEHRGLLRERRALEWTLSQVAELNLNGLNLHEVDETLPAYSPLKLMQHVFAHHKPFTQCLWCGNPYDENMNPFPEKRPKNGKKYCHVPNCEYRGDSNYSYHPKCCYGKWRKIYTTFVDRTVKKKWEKGFDFESEESKDSMRQAFKEFCLRRYEENLERSIEPVRTKEDIYSRDFSKAYSDFHYSFHNHEREQKSSIWPYPYLEKEPS